MCDKHTVSYGSTEGRDLSQFFHSAFFRLHISVSFHSLVCISFFFLFLYLRKIKQEKNVNGCYINVYHCHMITDKGALRNA